MILRPSQKLCMKIKAGPLQAMPLDKNPYADWSAHLFAADRTQYIILSNTKSLYSTVMFGKGITDDSHFIERAVSSIRELMEDDGHAFVYHRFVAPASETISFAQALDSSVSGSMNDLINHAKVWLADGELSPFEVGLKLNDVLLSSLAGSKALPYCKPREAFKDLINTFDQERE